MDKILTKKEIDFCDLYVYGCDPYKGNARKCYEEVFGVSGNSTLKDAKMLLAREDISEYIKEMSKTASYNTEEMKGRLTEKLLKILDETAEAHFTDRKGHELSVAPLRSVAVQASKALMEMYPVKVSQESKIEISGKDGDSPIQFNVIVPKE